MICMCRVANTASVLHLLLRFEQCCCICSASNK